MVDMLDPSGSIQYANPNPAGKTFVTPDQVARMMEYAKMLQGKSQLDKITSPWQGVNEIVNALVGGTLNNYAGNLERQSKDVSASTLPTRVNPISYSGGILPLSMGGKSYGAPSATKTALTEGAPTSSNSEGSNIKGIVPTESKGDYNAIGPTVTYKNGQTDHGYGKYQIMGVNVGPWTKEILGTEMTPTQFLKDKDAQEAVGKAKWAQYEGKYGPSGAARAWFAGEGGMNNPNAKDVNGVTVAQYEDAFKKALGFAPTNTQGGIEVAQNAPRAATTLAKPIVDPRLILQRPHITEGQFRGSQGGFGSWLRPEQQSLASNAYYSEFQPISVPYMGGQLLISPQNRSLQGYIPPLNKGEVKAGDVTIPTWSVPTLQPNGLPKMNIIPMQMGGPQGAAAPPPAIGAPIPKAGEGGAPPEGVPNLLKFGPEGEPAAGTPQIPNITTPPPPPGTFPAVAPPQAAAPAAPLSFAPTEGETKEVPPAPVPGAQPGTQVAQAYLPPALRGMIGEAQDIAAQGKLKEGQAQEEAKTFAKKYDGLSNAGRVATASLSELGRAQQVLNDPRMIQGFMAGPRLDLAKLSAFLGQKGLAGDPDAAAATEIFQKIISKNIVQDLKTELQGLGQIRLAEINLISQATGNIYNTLPANKAVLNIVMNAQRQIAGLARMAAYYAQGIRWDAKGNPRQTSSRGLDYGWDQTAQRYMEAHPIVPKDQIAAYEKVLRDDPAYNEANVKSTQNEYEGSLVGGTSTPTTSAPKEAPAKATPKYQQGAIAVNPSTNEKLMYDLKKGWIPAPK